MGLWPKCRTWHSIPSSKSSIKILKGMGPHADPWGTPLVNSRQLNFTPFTTSVWAHLFSQFLTQWRVCLSKPWLPASPEEYDLCGKEHLQKLSFCTQFWVIFWLANLCLSRGYCWTWTVEYFNKLSFSREVGRGLPIVESTLRDFKGQNSCTKSFLIKTKKVVSSRDRICAVWLHWAALALTVRQMH